MLKRIILIVAVSLLLLFSFFGCADEESAYKQWDRGYNGPDSPNKKVVRIASIDGDYGDVQIEFDLFPDDQEPRNVYLTYQGACAGNSQWIQGVIGGQTTDLEYGRHTIIWHTWDHEAGCAGNVKIRLYTDYDGEDDESSQFYLDNTYEGENGFYVAPLDDQGINDEESYHFDQALDVLLADQNVDFVATRYADTYEVHAARGSIVFQRIPTNVGYEYDVEILSGENPIGFQDPYYIPTYDLELAAGSNPNNIGLPSDGYPAGDPRLSFIEPEDDSYPYGYERIASYFDHPDSADFMINIKSYAHGDHELGAHGSLNIVQSRTPLVFWGKGIEPHSAGNLGARQVDIAPTVGALLGFEKTGGIDERGIYSHNNYLTWQDGHVLEDVLSGDTSESVLLFVSDGLTLTELMHQLETRGDELPNLSRLVNDGANFTYGSITNWPSVTYPSHNVIGSSIYSGHHGLVDNEFYERIFHYSAHPISQLVFTDGFWNPKGPGETLHEAVDRNFGDWNILNHDGAFTISLLDPSVHGADKADIEFRDESWEVFFPPLFVEWPPEIPGPNPIFLSDFSILGEQLLVQMAWVQLYHLFTSEKIGLPKYTIFNIMTTDGAGHAIGPHGNKMKQVFDKIDGSFGCLFDWLEQWSLIDDVTIILTADHGMEIGDYTRSGNPIETLQAAGIKLQTEVSYGAYLAIIEARFDKESVSIGQPETVTVYVGDEDDMSPIADAEITISDGLSSQTVYSDLDGYAQFTITASDDVDVLISHELYNEREYTIPAK